MLARLVDRWWERVGKSQLGHIREPRVMDQPLRRIAPYDGCPPEGHENLLKLVPRVGKRVGSEEEKGEYTQSHAFGLCIVLFSARILI